jgi:hypothetical protein
MITPREILELRMRCEGAEAHASQLQMELEAAKAIILQDSELAWTLKKRAEEAERERESLRGRLAETLNEISEWKDRAALSATPADSLARLRALEAEHVTFCLWYDNDDDSLVMPLMNALLDARDAVEAARSGEKRRKENYDNENISRK